jgi:hypothetical protein
MNRIEESLQRELAEAEQKAWDALGRYKFQMFGYCSAIWVHLNRIGDFKRPNPWKELERAARGKASEVPTLAKCQPCGCVVCTCETDDPCNGCGASHCGTHPVGAIPSPFYSG